MSKRLGKRERSILNAVILEKVDFGEKNDENLGFWLDLVRERFRKASEGWN